MTRNLIAITLAGAMLTPAGAAQAKSSGPEFTLAGHRLAQCLYDKRKAEVVGALAATSTEQAARYHNVLRTSATCSDITVTTREIEGASIKAPSDVMRGMLAEAALRKIDYSSLAPRTESANYQRAWFAGTGRDPTVDEMAVCTVEVNPAGVGALLKTTPDSSEESAVAQSLSATLSPCLPQGATLKANRQSLRAALAEALYHRATTPALATK